MPEPSYELAVARAEDFLLRVATRWGLGLLPLKRREIGYMMLEQAVTGNYPTHPDFVNAVGKWLQNPHLPKPEISVKDIAGLLWDRPAQAATVVAYLVSQDDLAEAIILTACISMQIVLTLPGAEDYPPEELADRAYETVWGRCEAWLEGRIREQADFERHFLPLHDYTTLN